MSSPDDTPRKPAKGKVAVALGYEPGKDPAPKVTAKGEGLVAENIVRIALDHGVEVRQDADLALILSKLDLDSFVPVEVYGTIAEVLSYVYKANAEKRWKLGVK